MNRLLALTGTVFLVVGCGKDETSEPKAECQLEAIDLSACDRSSLSALQAEGVWNTNISFDDGLIAPASIRFSPGEPLIIGLPLNGKQVSGDTFFLTSDITSTDGTPLRYAFAGCRATDATHVSGIVRVCLDGTATRKGTFEATRVTRRSGEAESSGLELVSETKLPRGVGAKVFVANGYAYVPARAEGLFVYDVKDPAHPVKVAEPKIADETWTSAVVKDNTLFLGTNGQGVRICDVTTPSAPVCNTSVLADKSVQVETMTLNGNLLYVASPSPLADIIILDVTTPSAPSQVTRYTVEGSEPTQGERPLGLAVANNRLYVSHWTFGLTVSNVEEPKTPKLIRRFPGPATNSVAVGTIGDRVVAFQGGDSWGSTVLALDVTSPAQSIVQVAQFPSRPEVAVSGLALSGNTLYVANFQDGLRMMDVTNPGDPKLVGYYNTWRETDDGRGITFYEGLTDVRVANDGLVYATETARGLLVFRPKP